MNPYKTLGLGKAATIERITKRYRDLAKRYHPDKAGDDPEAATRFAEVQAAFECLSDPDKRQHFDDTGAMPDPAAKTLRQAALEIVGALLAAAIQNELTNDLDPAGVDLLKIVRDKIAATLTQIGDQKRKAERTLTQLEETAKRFTSDNGENVLAAVARAPLEQIRGQLVAMAAAERNYQAAREELKHYKFDRKPGQNHSTLTYGGQQFRFYTGTNTT